MPRTERLEGNLPCRAAQTAASGRPCDQAPDTPGPAIGAAFASVPAALLAFAAALIAGHGLLAALGLASLAQISVFTAGLIWAGLVLRA